MSPPPALTRRPATTCGICCAGLVDAGTTLILTTQYLEEADRLADAIIVLDRGRIVAEGPPAELKAQIGGERIEVTLGSAEDLPGAELALGAFSDGAANIDRDSALITFPVRPGRAPDGRHTRP